MSNKISDNVKAVREANKNRIKAQIAATKAALDKRGKK